MTTALTTDERAALREYRIRLTVTHTPRGAPTWRIIDDARRVTVGGMFDNEAAAAGEAFAYLAEQAGQ